MDYNRIKKIPYFGDSSASNIKKALEVFNEGYPDYGLLGGLNIEFFSTSRAKEVCKRFNIEEILTMIDEDTFVNTLIELDGFEVKLANLIQEGIINKLDYIFDIMDKTNVKETKMTTITNGLNIVITGEVNCYNSREELSTILSRAGHSVKSSVSKKTDYLVTNTPNSGTEKNKKAKLLGVKVITEKEMMELLGLNGTI